MEIEPVRGLVRGIPFVPSPNCDERPGSCAPELIVIHNISLPPREFGGPWIERLFTNRLEPGAHPYFARIHVLRVSAHVLIRRDAGLTQFVAFHRRAWHAGESCYAGRSACNDYSVGIELEGADDIPYEPGQYQALADLVLALLKAYPSLSTERIAGHAEIAPGRKTDPGPAFEWARLRAALGSPAPGPGRRRWDITNNH
jgi:AmpD protein